MLKTLIATTLFLLATTVSVRAHDYWLQPQRFMLEPGDKTSVHLFVGDRFNSGAERPFDKKKTKRFELISTNGLDTDLISLSAHGKKPVLNLVAPNRAGNYLVAMERDWSRIELAPEKFNKYLQHEGLTTILKLRRDEGATNRVGRERYRRYLKALIQVGDRSDSTHGHRIEQRLEIRAQSNPYRLQPGERLVISVEFDKRPLRGVQVSAYNRHVGDTQVQALRTDDQGQATLMLNRSGVWLIRLVHMQRCLALSDVDWESFWAAYTFELK